MLSGLILAGSADFKTELSQSDMFDPRLQAKVREIKTCFKVEKTCQHFNIVWILL